MLLRRNALGNLFITAGSGTNGITLNTNARLKLGGGTTDYIYSDGSNVRTAGTFIVGSTLYVDNIDNASQPGAALIIRGVSGAAGVGGASVFISSGTTMTSNDVVRFRNNSTIVLGINYQGKLMFQSAGDSSASPGAATLNTTSGKSAVAAAASSVVITNSTVTTSSKVFVAPLDLDATLTSYKVAVGSGSFTVTGNAAATAAWKFDWFVIN